MASLTILIVVLTGLYSLSANAATGAERWPWGFDVLRQYPWLLTVTILVLMVVAGGVLSWMQLDPKTAWNDPPPPPPPDVPDWFVDRTESRAVVAALCRRGRQRSAATVSLSGAGGFGKTSLAKAVCAQKRVRRRYRSRIYFVTIGRDLRGRAAVAAKVVEVIRFITGTDAAFDDPHLAGARLGGLLGQRPRTLLVLDDVWEAEQLAPFLMGGPPCTRLVTTRNPELLPRGTQRITVDRMSERQARAVLTRDLPSLPEHATEALLKVTGRWALLLRLTNRLVAEQYASGADPGVVAERVMRRLRETGPAAVDDPASPWDLDDPVLRNQAVKASIEAATTLLRAGEAERYSELSVFIADEAVPVSVVALLWQASGGLTEEQTRSLCQRLQRLSLLSVHQDNGGTISLHDVVREYLRNELGATGTIRLNMLLVDVLAAVLPPAQPLAPPSPDPGRAWWQLRDGYLLDHLVAHMLAAGRTSLAEAVAGDLRWLEMRLAQRGPTAPWRDLTRIDTPHARSLSRSVAQNAHLLTPTDPPRALVGVLRARLYHHPHWHPQIAARQQERGERPCLTSVWPLPDTPAPAQQRTFTSHAERVLSVAVAPDGRWFATGGSDGTVRLWDPVTGTSTATLTGHTGPVMWLAVTPDGTQLTTGGSDGTVRIWDQATEACTATLTPHSSIMTSMALAPDGTWLATTGRHDEPLRIMDLVTRTATTFPTGHSTAVTAMAISPDGTWLVTAGLLLEPLRILELSTGTSTVLPDFDSTVTAVAVAPDGSWLATGHSDGLVRIWDRATETCAATLTGHTDGVTAVAVAPDGSWLATGHSDGLVRIWDRATETCAATFTGHTDGVTAVAVAPDGSWLATTSIDGTARTWDPVPASGPHPHTDHTDGVTAVAVAPDGSWLATGHSDGRVRIVNRGTGTCTVTIAGQAASGRARGVSSAAIAMVGDRLAIGSGDGTVQMWDPATGACTATLSGHTDGVFSVGAALDGTWLATGDADGAVRIWDPATGTCTATLTGHTGPVLLLAVAPDGDRLVASGFLDLALRVWDRTTGACIATLTGHTKNLTSVAFAPDGRLASGSADGTVRIWDPGSGTCTATIGLATASDRAAEVTSVAFAPEGRLAITSNDGTVRIWDTTQSQTVSLARADGALGVCAWGADGDLAVGGEAGLYLFRLLT
ncbi:NB-ARC domain-containing protein [Streptomyces sp. bgisy022]|uniref:NB-ARC domain-containing protein n=1 Tax=Streptomyces sp. bgisy022 TaxID=3413769 RepID=UPI003D74AB8B